jgi:16S rRNA processing protein RimM
MTGAKSELLQVARVLKSNGTEGEVLVGFRGISPEDLNVKEPVFIEFDGLPVPFFIESFTRKGTNRAIARLTGVKNLADAEELAGKDVFAVIEAIASGEDDDFLSPDELTGWTLLDADNRTVGEISGYEDIPGNLCVYVETADGQAMIPLHEDLILSVDENSRTITVAVPDGLL